MTTKNLKISQNLLPELLTKLANVIIDKYDLLKDNERDEFNKIFQSSISLVLVNPKVKKLCSCL